MSKDYKNTINLPKTDFAMKADLANATGDAADWYSKNRYQQIHRKPRSGRTRSSCMTARRMRTA